MILCGHCKALHATVAAVRACSQTPNIPSAIRDRDPFAGLEEAEREMHRMEAEADRAESRRDTANKVAKWDAEATLNEMLARVNELLGTREVPKAEWRWSRAVRALISGLNGPITELALKTAIARLEAYPEIPAIRALRKVEHEGLYRLSRDIRADFTLCRKGELVQVLRGKDSMHLYAKLVHFIDGQKRPKLTYVKGLIFEMNAAELLPVEEAEEITRKTGWCIFGHFLTNPKSIARGMGPKCFERYPHLAKNAEVA